MTQSGIVTAEAVILRPVARRGARNSLQTRGNLCSPSISDLVQRAFLESIHWWTAVSLFWFIFMFNRFGCLACVLFCTPPAFNAAGGQRTGSPAAGVTGGLELPCRCQEASRLLHCSQCARVPVYSLQSRRISLLALHLFHM